MLTFQELLLFALAAFVLVISPGPNMIYLISRSITQGRMAGLLSLAGVMVGFLFHIIMVSFGLTAILAEVPFLYELIKYLGVGYLLYLAFQAINPNGKFVFEARQDLTNDSSQKLFTMGLLTNMLNPKVAMFYLSFFPQFIKPAYGNPLLQSLQLGITQMLVSLSVNFSLVLTASQMARFFAQNPFWIKIQKWFMASILVALAVRMAKSKA
ncbi:LysE family translocator [Flectobacillus roseus]|uniref:LysE family translocator n=1 Tax=Flectobacillus roseus TaxID=502259 RepID=UPI0024B85252|nr:LysE family translocator [Flectobacillus roseus]MDI9871212.1 LysE family translocator [Flectobacillus roseus]